MCFLEKPNYGVIDCYAKTQAVRIVNIEENIKTLQSLARETLIRNYFIDDVLKLTEMIPGPLAYFLKTGTHL